MRRQSQRLCVVSASLLIALLSAWGGTAEAGKAAGKASAFRYCGGWKGYHTDSKAIGLGTAELIAPSWAITAAHLARVKAKTPAKRGVKISFTKNKVARVKRAFLAPSGDLALVQFTSPVHGVKPVSLSKQTLKKKDGPVTFTLVGHAGGLHFHRGRRGVGCGTIARHVTTRKNNPGKPGDSGGAWVIENAKSGKHILFAVIHGGGRGTQPAALHKWINKTMQKSGEKADWVALPARRPTRGKRRRR